MRLETIDGNNAAAFASYYFTEIATIFPITPSSPMAELVDEWAAKGKKNIFGQPVRVVEMQSEAGAAGAMHGALTSGALTTTYTASQGLLLMIPNIYKMVGELLPGVLHVSARALATHALSIFGDHQDVMACRQTGAIMLCSANVQEVMDLGVISHLAALKASLPVIHFFDGFRTSHEYKRISVLESEDINQLIDYEYIDRFKSRGLNPEHPVIRGTAQNPDIYFQGREVQNKYFDAVPDIVVEYMDRFAAVTGRKYKPYEYYGAADADRVVVAMGSVCDTIEETVDYLISKGEKVGCVKVHLYRPFAESAFLAEIPQSVQKIAVLDRTKEPGAPGEPLYLDVVKAFSNSERTPIIVGGRYGLGSKDTRPSQIISVFDNLAKDNPKNHFTIGIVDDVTNLSLPESTEIIDSPSISCKFWGLGSDGTVGANKQAIQIIGDNTDYHVQAYFSYDSKKSGGSTVSHLRFSKKPIKSPYLVYSADYIACHNKSFVNHIDVLKGIKENGIFVLNCDWKEEELEKFLPDSMKREIASKNISFYIVDAISIAGEIGLGNRINMIMQTIFFKLINIIPIEDAVKLLKESIEHAYGKKGQKIVEMNYMAVDNALEGLVKVNVPKSWSSIDVKKREVRFGNDFVDRIQIPMARHEGDELPVSAFLGMEDGSFPSGTTKYEKRGIAVLIPQWIKENCIECGMCSFVCPHATIRLFLLDDEEKKRAPLSFKTREVESKGDKYYLRVQVSPLDCTGCGNCADICPPKDKALVMKPMESLLEEYNENWEYAVSVKPKEPIFPVNTIKGSQYMVPYLEFSGACPGCGETPYVRLVTQLFGNRMLIANATGCSSIWGASAPSMSYSKDAEGRGPAWANSLFEDNAEFGFGMYLAIAQKRERLYRLMQTAKQENIPDDLRTLFEEWIKNRDDGNSTLSIARKIKEYFNRNPKVLENRLAAEIKKDEDYLVKKSVWIIGGDGWAYDIGYGGLDHVLASGADVNILVLDTEIYSNTGGQASKSTPASAVAKFAAGGKKTRKKDLGFMAISYGDVYVAQISMGANMNHTLKTILEAESYNGPSLIIAYAPCISHGIKTGMGTSIRQEKRAVEAGYWHLYRYDPRLKEKGKNPFILDSRDPKESYQDFLQSEIRYTQLANVFPEASKKLYELSEKYANERLERYKKLK